MAQKEQNSGTDDLDGSRICGVCSLDPQCISWQVGQPESDQLDKIVKHPPAIDEGDHLFRVGDNLTAVYAVRNGAFKTFAFNSDGHEYVLGFVFPGELIGFDGVYSRRHGCNAVAVEESAVCTIPYYDLASLMERSAKLREQILRLASQGFGDRIINASLPPDARVANFFLDISRRTGNGDASEPLEFPISTHDLASYLRITAWEIDNLFNYFLRKGVIYFNNRRLQLLDLDTLNKIAQQK